MAGRRRLDGELVRRGLVASRTEALRAIERGLVRVGGRPALKPSTLVTAEEALDVRGDPQRFVSRGGEKLDAGLERFDIDVLGRDALDAGSSTGGFTDALLRRGAARVAAVDVGYGQLAWSLRQDPRVTVLERTNARDLRADRLPFRAAIVVADLSFISLRLVLHALASVTAPDGDHVLLVKPQFEAAPGEVAPGGVVRDPGVWRSAIRRVVASSREAGLAPQGIIASPLPGPAGNVEFLLWARATETAGSLDGAAIDRAVDEGVQVASAS